jgi:phage virion morphogenesis protein
MKVTIRSEDLINNLNKLITRLADRKVVLRQVGELYKDDINRRIIFQKTDPDGVPWAPWAKSTARARLLKGTAGRGLLYDGGKLARSFRVVVGKDEVSVGTNVSYAPYLEFGTGRMPARRFMGLSKEAAASISDTLRNYIGMEKL